MNFRATLFFVLLSQHLWARGPVIETRATIGDSRSTTVTISHYHYGTDSRGHRGFLDEKGKIYEENEGFIRDAAEAIRRIEEGGPTGRALIGFLIQAPQTVCIVFNPVNLADIDEGAFVYWNPRGERSAPDENGDTLRPAYIGMAHELAHISDVWNGTVNRRTWMTLEGEDGNLVKVPYAELYATHVENKIRAENGIALRVSYATSGSDGDRDLASLIIRPGTRESLYYNVSGQTDYKPLRRREEGERY